MALFGKQYPPRIIVVPDLPKPGGELLVGLRQVSCWVAADPVEALGDHPGSVLRPDVVIGEAGEPEVCGPDRGIVGNHLDAGGPEGDFAFDRFARGQDQFGDVSSS